MVGGSRSAMYRSVTMEGISVRALEDEYARAERLVYVGGNGPVRALPLVPKSVCDRSRASALRRYESSEICALRVRRHTATYTYGYKHGGYALPVKKPYDDHQCSDGHNADCNLLVVHGMTTTS